MGCCISSTKRGSSNAKPPSRHQHSPPQPHEPHVTTTRTPPPLEKETVKEVLSETPVIVKPQKTSTPVTATTTQNQEPKTLTQKNNKKHQEVQEISQASEICSNITDTASTATTTTATTTTTITEIRGDEVTSKKRVNKSPAKVPRKRPYIGDREWVSQSPAQKTGQVIRTAAGQRHGGSTGVRRDFGRSPATRTAGGVGRGRMGASPGKVTGKAGGRSGERKNKEESVNGPVLRQQQRREGNESLENPLRHKPTNRTVRPYMHENMMNVPEANQCYTMA
ncbi:unnamed protein product [Dovyalis caffra]|uniref:Uncharacterized protein n=1 Tax=Dovyalis caffra TaxID=77055 RepID=A0AAV1RQR5_9ROSI|nr:unnamed protein product [Dovyalis caffra]